MTGAGGRSRELEPDGRGRPQALPGSGDGADPPAQAERTEAQLPAGAWLRWLTGVVLAGLATMVAALVAGGGEPRPVPAGLPDPGLLTGWGLPVLRLAADASAVAAVGFLLAAAALLPNTAGQLRGSAFTAVRLAGWTAFVLVAAALAQVVLTVSDVVGVPPTQALDPHTLTNLVASLPQARALVVQAGLAAVLALCAWLTTTTRGAVVLLMCALAALTPPLLTGHSATAGFHTLAVASLTVHVLAASLWVGGLAALTWVWLRRHSVGPLVAAVPRFSALALWCAVAVGLSGVVNAAVRLGSVAALLSTSYGVLVLAKTAALVLLAALGAGHRRRTIPRLVGQHAGAAFGRLAAGEVVVMAATIGLAVALSRTPPPPPPGGATESAVRALLGFDLPPAPTPLRYLTETAPDGFFLAFVVLAGALYATGLRALRRRGDPWPVGRTVAWYAGLLVVLYATCGGLAAYAHVLFSAHMVAHMTLSMAAPILLVLGGPVTLALRTLPGGRTPRERGPRHALLAVLHSAPVRLLTHPLVALGIFVGSLFGLYFTPLLGGLMANHLGHTLMAAHFLAVGGLFFYVLVGVDPSPRRIPHLARIAVLFAAAPFHAFFSVAIMSATTLLAGEYYQALGRPYALDLLADQRTGGSLGWALGEIPVLAVLAVVFVAWVRADDREARRLDRADERAAAAGEDDALASYNAYLAALHRRDEGAR